MAAIDYSIGFTQAEVEEIMAAQKAELKKTMAAYANPLPLLSAFLKGQFLM